MSESIEVTAKSMFPDVLRAKPYRVVLYDMQTGWRDETRTMIVDEAHGICKIEYDKTTVHNSHGTDVDYELYCSKDHTFEQMADILENEYSPAAISKAHEGQRAYYKQDAYSYVDKLRESGAIFADIQSAGKTFLQKQIPDCEVIKLNYSSSSTVVFEAISPSGKNVIVKLTRVPKARRDAVNSSFDRVMQLGGNNNLIPIQGKLWFPLDTHHEALVIWLPVLETIGTERKYFSRDLSYKSFTQDKEKYGAPFDQRINLAVGLANALKTLHDNGLVHHDVKPENLFFEKTENEVRWYLGDFDSIKPVEQQYDGKTSGTLSYAAPEILDRKPFSFSSDIYSWGRTMFFLAQGDIPNGDVPASVEIEGSRIRLCTKGSSQSWHDNDPRVLQFYRIIAKAMAPNPLERYESGNELLEALKNIDKAVDESAQPKCNQQPTPAPQEKTTQPPQAEPVSECRVQTDDHHKLEGKTIERIIQWNSGCFDEIDLVYDKAAENEVATKIISELEAGALAEAKSHSGMIRLQDRPITPEQYDSLPDNVKEQLIAALSNIGLSSFAAPLTEPKIIVRLSPQIQQVRCCTAFSILNRLEKLDGAFNVLHPQATIEIQAPLGGKQGLVHIEMLISMLYPWLKVTEVSSNEIAAKPIQTQPKPQQKPVEQKAPVLTQPQVQNKPVNEAKNTQPGFWARLFGKKKKNEGTATEQKEKPAGQAHSPHEKFFSEMWAKPSFRSAFSYAKAEINSVIIKKQFGLKGQAGGELTVSEWEGLSDIQQLQYILALGNHGIVPSALLCIDFVEIIPYCLAITLLYIAYTGQKETQMLDTGDGSDITVFKSAVNLLSGCYAKWNCKILTE